MHRIDLNKIKCRIQSKRLERDFNQMLILNWSHQHGSALSQALVALLSTSSKAMANLDTSLKQIDLVVQKAAVSYQKQERRAFSKHRTRLA
jgi:hypothetical protein